MILLGNLCAIVKVWTTMRYYTTRKLLTERLERDGYLFIRGAIDRETVLRARSYVIHDMGRVTLLNFKVYFPQNLNFRKTS